MNIFLDIGFRFLPPDEELVSFFLRKKMVGDHDHTCNIREVDLLQQEPWDLPAKSIVRSKYPEWVFFYKLNKKSTRQNERSTKAGYWKSTGQDRNVSDGDRVVGSKKTLVFHVGRTPGELKTDWVMHEFRVKPELIPPNADTTYVVGILRNKSAEWTENSTSNDVQPSSQYAVYTSQNDAVAVSYAEVARQLQSNMDHEMAVHAQLEDQSMFEYEVSPSFVVRGNSNNVQNMMEQEGISLDDIDLGNDMMEREGISLDDIDREGISLDDIDLCNDMMEREVISLDNIDLGNDMMEQGISLVEIDLGNGITEQERDFWKSMFAESNEHSDVEIGDPFHYSYGATNSADSSDIDIDSEWPANVLCDQDVLTSDGIGNGHMGGFNQRRMVNGCHQDEILIMSSFDLGTVTSHQINCLESAREEISVNSRTCRSRYDPKPLCSVVQAHPSRVQLLSTSSREAVVSRHKAREGGIHGPVVEHVQNKKSILQSNKDPKMEQDRKTERDVKSRSKRSAGRSRKNSFNSVEMSQRSCKSNSSLVCLGNVIVGLILLILVVWEIMSFIRKGGL